MSVRLISYDEKLVPLPNAGGKFGWLPRCNKLNIEITNELDSNIEYLILTVFRRNSKIGTDNFTAVPIKTYNLLPETIDKYEIIVFNPFNEKFDGIEIRITIESD